MQQRFAREQLQQQLRADDAAADAGSLADLLPGPGGNGLNDVDSLLHGLASITVSQKKYCDKQCKISGLLGRIGRCSMCHSGARPLWQQLEPEHVQMTASCCCLLAVCWCLHAMAGT